MRTGPLARLGRVDQQVDEDLLDRERVTADLDVLVVELAAQLVRARAEHRPQQARHAVEHHAQRLRRAHRRPEPHEVEQARDRAAHLVGGELGLVQELARAGRRQLARAGVQQIDVVDDRRQRRAQVVRHQRREPAGLLEALPVHALRQRALLLGDLAHQQQAAALAHQVARASEHCIEPAARPPHDRDAERRGGQLAREVGQQGRREPRGELEPRDQRRRRWRCVEYAPRAVEHGEWCADVVQMQPVIVPRGHCVNPRPATQAPRHVERRRVSGSYAAGPSSASGSLDMLVRNPDK